MKAIPGAPDDIIYALGFLVDRMSVNLELPTAEGLKRLAPNKKPKNLIRPIQQIQRGIQTQRVALGKDSRMERAKGNQYLSNSIFNEKNTSSVEEKSVFSIMEDAQKSVKKNDNVNRRQNDADFFKETRLERDIGSNIDTENSMSVATNSSIENSLNSNIGRRGRENAAMSDNTSQMGNGMSGGVESKITLPSHFLQTTGKREGAQFVPAGQSTQMIIGASGESDFHLLSLTQRLYQQYDLKRVFLCAAE